MRTAAERLLEVLEVDTRSCYAIVTATGMRTAAERLLEVLEVDMLS
jgi:hypothetical protein